MARNMLESSRPLPQPARQIQQQVPGPQEAPDEKEIGEQIHRTIMESFYPYSDPEAAGYVSRIGERLASHAERRDIEYQFTILDHEKIYATSAPGGYVYVTTAMLAFLQNEAELAAVLGHEIGQLQNRDPRLSASRKLLVRLTETGKVAAPALGQIGMLALVGLMTLEKMADARGLSLEAKMEEADLRAMQYMTAAGYDPQGMIDLFYNFADADPQDRIYFLDYNESRPLTVERARAMQRHFSELPMEGQRLEVRREEYQEMTRTIKELSTFS